MQPEGILLRSLLETLRNTVADWPQPPRWELKSIYVMATAGSEGHEIQSAVDGFVDTELTQRIFALDWPRPSDMFLFKQLFVLRAGHDEK